MFRHEYRILQAMQEDTAAASACFSGISRENCQRNCFRYPAVACRRIKKVGELNRARWITRMGAERRLWIVVGEEHHQHISEVPTSVSAAQLATSITGSVRVFV